MPPKRLSASASSSGASKRGRAPRQPPSPPRVDIRDRYGAPFAIFTEREGARYTSFSSLPSFMHYCIDWDDMETFGIADSLRECLHTLGWEYFADNAVPIRDDICCEFYTTMSVADNRQSIHARLFDKPITVTAPLLHSLIGINSDGVHDFVTDDSARTIDSEWQALTGFTPFKSQSPAGLLKEPHMSVLHRFMCPAFFGTSEDNRITRSQLYAFTCVRHQHPYDSFALIVDVMERFLKTKRSVHFYLGHIITVLARHFCPGRFEERPGRSCSVIDASRLVDWGLAREVGPDGDITYQLVEWQDRKVVKDRLRDISEAPMPPQQLEMHDLANRFTELELQMQTLTTAQAAQNEQIANLANDLAASETVQNARWELYQNDQAYLRGRLDHFAEHFAAQEAHWAWLRSQYPPPPPQ